MRDVQRNEGVIVTGGSHTAEVMAVGRNTSVVVTRAAETLDARGQKNVAAKLQALLDAIDAHGSELPDQKGTYGMTARVAEELARDDPDGVTVTGFLDRLTSMVGSARTVAAAVTALAHTVAVTL